MSDEVERQTPRSGPSSPARFGPAAIVREGPPSEEAQLLAWFVKGAAAARVERRLSPRITAVEHRAWLGWWAGSRQFATVAAWLDNISQGGARLLMVTPPPTQQIVWLCLGVPDPTECVQAKVLEVRSTPDADDVSSVRLAFGTPCPENLYRIAIGGLAVRKRSDQDRRDGDESDRASLGSV
jgi:hypothetical protein